MMERHLITLLVKLGVVAVLASFMVRTNAFKRMLMREQRTLNQRLVLALSFAGIFGTGVAIRVLTHGYQAADLGLEASLLAGLLAGYVTGLLSGVLISIPAMLAGEYLTMPLLAAVGVLGGLLRDCAPDTEEIWRFSPFSTSASSVSSSAATTTGEPPSNSSSCWRSFWRNSCDTPWGTCSRARSSIFIHSGQRPIRWPLLLST